MHGRKRITTDAFLIHCDKIKVESSPSWVFTPSLCLRRQRIGQSNPLAKVIGKQEDCRCRLRVWHGAGIESKCDNTKYLHHSAIRWPSCCYLQSWVKTKFRWRGSYSTWRSFGSHGLKPTACSTCWQGLYILTLCHLLSIGPGLMGDVCTNLGGSCALLLLKLVLWLLLLLPLLLWRIIRNQQRELCILVTMLTSL